jgi:hypothetical protein
MIDDMHSWYHRKKMRTASRNQIGAIHIYDSIAVIAEFFQRATMRDFVAGSVAISFGQTGSVCHRLEPPGHTQ